MPPSEIPTLSVVGARVHQHWGMKQLPSAQADMRVLHHNGALLTVCFLHTLSHVMKL